jgi:hypothetical protein
MSSGRVFQSTNHPQHHFCHIMRLANYSECIMLYLLPYFMENMCFQNHFCHIMRLANYSECIMLYLLPYFMENMCFQNTPASPILPLPATNDTSSVTRFFLNNYNLKLTTSCVFLICSNYFIFSFQHKTKFCCEENYRL